MQDEARELTTAAEIKIDELHRALECHIAGEADSWSREERKDDCKAAHRRYDYFHSAEDFQKKGTVGKMRIVVYGSASKDTPKEFKDASFELGKLLAQRGHVCVNGGGNTGCMGALSDGCISGGGKVRCDAMRRGSALCLHYTFLAPSQIFTNVKSISCMECGLVCLRMEKTTSSVLVGRGGDT